MELQRIVDVLLKLPGAIASAVVDYENGMLLASGTNDPNYDLDVVGALGSDVITMKKRIMKRLEMDDVINDVVITLTTQYHLFCLSKIEPSLFIYLAVKRDEANLSRTRSAIFQAEKLMVI